MVAVASLFVALAASVPEACAASDETPDRIAAFLATSTGPDGHLGAVALVARDGVLVTLQAAGYRDVARTLPMRDDAIFRVYSMTKTVTTVAALMLVEDGRLALDAPIARWLPRFAHMEVFAGGTCAAPVLRAVDAPITLRHLLTHTAGFATGAPGEAEATCLLERADLHGSANLATFADRLARVPLASGPGVRFRYDGTSIEIVARLVEIASGVPFDTFVMQRILVPLGMRDTGFTVAAADRGRVVDLASSDDDGRLVRVLPESGAEPGDRMQRYPSGAGGLYSTAADWLRLCTLLLDGGTLDGTTLLSPASVETMMTDRLPAATIRSADLGPGEGFGFGGFVLDEPSARSRPGSRGTFGWSGAASTYFTIDRRRRLVAILLLQYLPRGRGHDLPNRNVAFQRLVHDAAAR